MLCKKDRPTFSAIVEVLSLMEVGDGMFEAEHTLPPPSAPGSVNMYALGVQ